jgi:molecular chaperone GrpE
MTDNMPESEKVPPEDAAAETPGENWDDALDALVQDVADADAQIGEEVATAESELARLVAERTADLQRLQAEYANYKKRVDRDRDQARLRGIETVIKDLLPVLDGIDAARAHGELEGGAAMLADELGKVATRHGLESYGAEGDPFDPHIHEALMHMDKPGFSVTAVAQVFQAGYRIGDRVLRPARVAVADPTEEADDADPATTSGAAAKAAESPTSPATPDSIDDDAGRTNGEDS